MGKTMHGVSSTASAHTPGPWRLCAHLRDHDQCSCGYRGGIWGSDDEHIVCEIGSQPTPGQEGLEPPRYPREVEFANARLIAAAPEMLAALKRLVNDSMFIHHPVASQMAIDAIALAEAVEETRELEADAPQRGSQESEVTQRALRGR
jgi:hypothetical protein